MNTYGSEYLDLASAARLLAAQGFNRLDIECVLDLTGPSVDGRVPLWRADRIERLAARAYWLGRNEAAALVPAAAA
ncbi:MAG TPA: hypothetical protein VF449_01775 [Parvibaculum sp.]